MSDSAVNQTSGDADEAQNEDVSFQILPVEFNAPKYIIDLTTVFGLIFSIGLIAVAAYLGQQQADFFNLPSLLIVVFGTLAVTTISYSAEELKKFGASLNHIFTRKIVDNKNVAFQLVNLAARARKHGILSLTRVEDEMRGNPYLLKAVQMVGDGAPAQDVDIVLEKEADQHADSISFSASILRKGAEIAPAMGLIGTLVGLVQMLAQLDDPSRIGPAMALALLTTLYGAILGNVVLAPLSVKMERVAEQDALSMTMVRLTAASIAKQENPRHLETLLNSLLPAKDRIYFF